MLSRIYQIWKNLSDFGVHLFVLESDKKYRRIQNQLLLVFIGALISLTSVISISGWLPEIEGRIFFQRGAF